jgi:type III pantothenate kinase
MPGDLIVMNVGNTHAQMAVVAGRGLAGLRRVRTASLVTDPWLQDRVTGDVTSRFFVASVVPAASEVLVARLGRERVTFLEVGMVQGLDFSMVDARTVGADRLANAVGAAGLAGAPVIVLDCGTAITSVAVDRQRRFRGGTIMPGRRLMRRALADNTGLLPFVEVNGDLPAVPGTSTAGAIAAGVDVGALGAAERIVKALRAGIGEPDCLVLAVGGDAPFFVQRVPGLQAGPDDLTLQGVAGVGTRVLGLGATGDST